MMKRSRQRNFGGLPEWLKGADCKSVGYAYTGSNPVAPICSAIVSTRSQFDEVAASQTPVGIAVNTSNPKLSRVHDFQ